MSKRIDVLNGNILKTLLLLSFPILVCGLFQQLYNLVDTIIIGRFVGGDGIAIVGGSCSMLINLFNGTSTGIISGSIVVAANVYGAGKLNKVNKCVETSLIISLIGGLGIMLIYMVFATGILSVLSVPADLLPASANYLAVYALGFPACFVFQMVINLQRALGETKRPTNYLIASFLLNIVFDVLFVIVFKLNERGVAYAYIATQFISAAVVLKSLSMQSGLDIRRIQLDGESLKGIMLVGLPTSMTSLLYSLTNIVIQSTINLLGNDVIAGFAIYIKVENLLWIAMTCIGFAISTFVSQNYGAMNYRRIRDSIKTSLGLGFGVTLLISMLIFGLRYPLAGLFTTDTLMIAQATRIMAFMPLFYFTYTTIEVLSGILKGIGKAIIPTVITLSCVCGIRLAYILIYARGHLEILNILKAYPLSWFLTSCAFVIYFIIEKRRVLDAKGNAGVDRSNA